MKKSNDDLFETSNLIDYHELFDTFIIPIANYLLCELIIESEKEKQYGTQTNVEESIYDVEQSN